MEENKIAIVTGGANGIGKAIVNRFCREDYTVILVDKEEEEGIRVCRELKDEGMSIIFKKCDVGNYKEVKTLFTEIKSSYPKVDVLINNAGISKFKNFWDMEEKDWEEVISTNLSSMFFMSKEAALLMKDLGGSIINMASTRAAMSEPHTEAYSASKGGIVSLSHALAITLSEYNIKVNSISPGWIETGDYGSLREKDHFQHPSNRVGTPDDVARACLFLCHEENNFINGENLVIDGGMTRKMIYEH
ncbi:SDR family oxidoreductase [Rossellomorea vietnamensis]|uniref:SDR family oxidoreductase n=1 Tax=Rossellomorea vietnamensis TaxID=218284 RepID=A0A5D4NQD8_9BACI|nr:SDR family oxidoreductase [Rossellomorea vietnamensis]TYS15761.1 SDR family oxidoreductase [Rossellomorea vietnamensis]